MATCAGVAVAHQGVCGADAGADAGGTRGFCNTDLDCVFQPGDSCCGTCLALGDQVIPRGPQCGGVACAAPPGGCSCVNHMCKTGILQSGASCNMQHDACGGGLACCVPCGTAPIDGSTCAPPICVSATIQLGKATCPLFP
jgi:hypothetical protein